jgi:hypothetical protein
MVAVFRDEDMSQQARTSKTAFDRPRGCSRFDDAITAGAGELRPDVANNLEAVGDVLQLLGNIFAELAQLRAAIRAAITFVNLRDHFSLEMCRQWLTPRPDFTLLGWRRSLNCRLGLSLCHLLLFKLKLELLKLEDDLFAPGAENHMPQLLDHELHMLDTLTARAQLVDLLGEGLSVRIYFRFKAPNLLITISGQRCEFFLMCVNQRHQCVTIEQVQIRVRSTFHERSMPLAQKEYTGQKAASTQGNPNRYQGLDGYFRRPCSLDASPINAF